MRQKQHVGKLYRTGPARGKSPSVGKVYIYGKHALMEALAEGALPAGAQAKVIRKVFLAADMRDGELQALLKKHAIPTAPLAADKDKELVGREAAHQGVIALMDPSALFVPFDDFIASLDLKKNPAIAILGEVQDPHNVGAIIRSAAAFGLAGVFIPERNQAPITGAVVKASSGMVFRVPLVSIGNVNATLKTLKERGFWVYGLAMKGTATLGAEAFDAPSVFVIGNEGAGVREKTLAACDVTLSIPMHTRTESLNAAVSAAVVFYEWSRKHPEAL